MSLDPHDFTSWPERSCAEPQVALSLCYICLLAHRRLLSDYVKHFSILRMASGKRAGGQRSPCCVSTRVFLGSSCSASLK